jgi:hypothetical protein
VPGGEKPGFAPQAADAAAAPPAVVSPDPDSDLRQRARELYAPRERFAPVTAAEPVDQTQEAHDWPWNRRPDAAPAPAPAAETVIEVVAQAASAPVPEPAPAPVADIAPAVPAAPEPAAPAPAAVESAPAPAAEPKAEPKAEPAPEPEPEPKGPPRRGWWRRLAN